MTRQPIMRLTDFTSTDLTVERMGAGGFGLVFMGPDRAQGGQWRALKTLRPELLALRPSLQDLFISEGLTWVGLWPHPNLLNCQWATEIDGRVYLVLDYAAEGSLRDLLPLGQPFATRLTWAQHIAAGLVALHTPDPELLRPRPLVHRDLKPENVLVDEDGQAQITDFGLAAAVADALQQDAHAAQAFALVETLAAHGAHAAQAPGAAGASQATQATRTTRFQTRATAGATAGARGGVGTIAYMPPEQWQVDAQIGPPADLYAFGLLLSELLVGRHGLADLEEDRAEDGWYQLHTHGTPRPLRGGPAEGAARLPGELEALYGALLAKRPEERPAAGEALAVLRRAAAALGEEPYTPPDYYPRTDARRLMKWHNWAITCARFGRLEEALTRNGRALALAPNQFDVLNNRGNILAELGLQAREEAGDEGQARHLLEEALACHTRALAVAPDDLRRNVAQGGRGARLRALGRYAEADAAYAAALALVPNNGIRWYNRALNALAWGQAEAAAGHTAGAARILAAGERYVGEAQRCGYNPPGIPVLLADIQQARAQLGR